MHGGIVLILSIFFAMEILYLLVPLAVILAGVIVWAFIWSIKSGQFDDLEGPAHRILMDPDEPRYNTTTTRQARHQHHIPKTRR